MKDESKKTSLYGNIYDFVVDYKPIVGVDPIYDMHNCTVINCKLTVDKN